LESIAVALGNNSTAKGAIGCWIVLAERNDNRSIKNVKAVKIDGEKIKADTWYRLENGEFSEVK